MKSQVWIDSNSIVRNGIAIDYDKLLEQLQESVRQGFEGRYYCHIFQPSIGADTAPNTTKRSKIEDEGLIEWQLAEQQRAEAAGFALHLSPVWSEKVRCLFCSCLNAITFPAPALLDLQADLAAWTSQRSESIFLLSDNPALVYSLCKTRSGGSSKNPSLLQDSGIRLLAFDDSFEQLQKYSYNWPLPQREVLEAASKEAVLLQTYELEHEEPS